MIRTLKVQVKGRVQRKFKLSYTIKGTVKHLESYLLNPLWVKITPMEITPMEINFISNSWSVQRVSRHNILFHKYKNCGYRRQKTRSRIRSP